MADEAETERNREKERERQRERAQAFLDKFGVGDAKCPVCGNEGWAVAHVFELREYDRTPGIVLSGGPVFPVVPVVCSTCAYTRFFNAIRAGVIERSEPQPEPDPESSDAVESEPE